MTTALIADDHEQNLYMLQTLLQGHGYQVVTANNGAEALEIARENQPDIIISDILMPVMDGFTLCHQCKLDDDLKAIPFVFYTATYTSAKDESLARSLGADHFMIKPAEPEKFIKMMDQVLTEFENQSRSAPEPPPTAEPVYYRQYNETLIRKLEQRNVQLKEARKTLEQDIARLRAMEARLRDSEESFRLLFAQNPNPMWVYDLSNLAFLEVNQSAVDLYGYSREEFLQMQLTDIRPAEDVARLLADVAQPRPDFQYSGEWRHKTKSGKILDVIIVSHRLEFTGRDAVLVVVRDITLRKQAQAEIKRRNRELTLLNRIIAASAVSQDVSPEEILEIACRELVAAFGLSHAAAGLIDKQQNNIELVAESRPPGAESLLGQTIPLRGNPVFQEILGHQTALAVTDVQNDPRLASLRHLSHSRGTVSLLILPLIIEAEIVGAIALGATKPHQFSIEEVNLSASVADQLAGVLARIRLAREREKLAEQYYQAQKMEAIGQLTAGIAHDFNNLLTAINGFANLLKMELPDHDPQYEMVNNIYFAGQRAANLVRQLLAFSRKQIIAPQILDVNTIVKDINEMLQRIIGEHIELTTKLKPGLWSVKIDPSQIEQIILNLAVNARDAMPGGGKLMIETTNVTLDADFAGHHLGVVPGDYVMLTVSDTGVGMSEAVKRHIFEPFYTTKKTGKGTGLGLATVYGIVNQNHGSVWVYSEEGQGSSFKVYLPRVAEIGVTTGAAPRPTEMPGGDETILLVEDNSEVRELTQLVLQRLGYNVLNAEDGETALQLADDYADPIHLLLTDVVMPGMSGKVLAETLITSRSELQIIFMSGYTDETIMQQGSLDPTVTFLQKPFSPVILAQKIRDVLG